MASGSSLSVADEEQEDCYNDAFDQLPPASSMDLPTALEECKVALDLFLNNRFNDALKMLTPWANNSIYHALGKATILGMQAMMTYESEDIAIATTSAKESIDTCCRFRKKLTVTETLSSIIGRQQDGFTEEEMHAELCYAECLLQRAALTFIQDENLISFIKGGMKIRSSYQIYKSCQNILQQSSVPQGKHFLHFQGGVSLGIGAFNLMLSMLPSRVLRLLEFVGFSGNKEYGLQELHKGASACSIRSVLCTFVLLFHYTFISIVLGNGRCNISESERLIQPYQKNYPKCALFLMYTARIEEVKGNIEEALILFQRCKDSQNELVQLHHICFWEMMWCSAFLLDWPVAYHLASRLAIDSRWSKATYIYQKAAFLSLMSAEQQRAAGEQPEELFRQVPGLLQKIAGKSIPMEKFAVRKSRRYLSADPTKLILPALEMMYLWNAFCIVGKRPDLIDRMLFVIEEAEVSLQARSARDVLLPDDTALLQLLKGVCLRHAGRLLQAELCFHAVCQSEAQIRYDHYLVPCALFELASLHEIEGNIEEARKHLLLARNGYKNYSMESRIHFRLHATLASLGNGGTNGATS
uniref:tetratricopeptide repeat protein 39B-like isoform X2 n=1 Tax=Myxine glutinosa TaxID=7769 RepID=UPI00358ED26D